MKPSLCFLVLPSLIGSSGHALGDPVEPRYAWTRTIGGPESADYCQAVGVASDGSVYFGGGCGGTNDFDPTAGVDLQTGEAFLTKLHPDGGYAWTRTFRVGTSNHVRGIAVSPDENVFITGTYSGQPDFDPTAGVDVPPCNGGFFVTKLTQEGGYVWTRCLPGLGPNDLAADSSGSVVVTGSFSGNIDFDPGISVDNHQSIGAADIFVLKFNAGGTFAWARTFGSASPFPNEDGMSITTDSTGAAIVAGRFRESADFDPTNGSDVHVSAGDTDAFVSKLNSDGSYAWTHTWGTAGTELMSGVTVSRADDVYATGRLLGSADFDPTSGVDMHNSSGMFVTMLHPDGMYGWTVTDFSPLEGISIGSDTNDRTISTGHVGPGFVVVATDPNQISGWTWHVAPQSPASAIAYDIAVDTLDSVVFAGIFYGTVNFNAGGSDLHTSNGSRDIFVTKLIAGRGVVVPTLSFWGVVALTIMIGCAGAIVVRRRHGAAKLFDSMV